MCQWLLLSFPLTNIVSFELSLMRLLWLLLVTGSVWWPWIVLMKLEFATWRWIVVFTLSLVWFVVMNFLRLEVGCGLPVRMNWAFWWVVELRSRCTGSTHMHACLACMMWGSPGPPEMVKFRVLFGWLVVSRIMVVFLCI